MNSRDALSPSRRKLSTEHDGLTFAFGMTPLEDGELVLRGQTSGSGPVEIYWLAVANSHAAATAHLVAGKVQPSAFGLTADETTAGPTRHSKGRIVLQYRDAWVEGGGISVERQSRSLAFRRRRSKGRAVAALACLETSARHPGELRQDRRTIELPAFPRSKEFPSVTVHHKSLTSFSKIRCRRGPLGRRSEEPVSP